MSHPGASQPFYYLAIRGDQKGPLTTAQVLKVANKEKYTNQILIWHEGMTNWTPLVEVAPFDELFGSPQTLTSFDTRNEELEKTNPHILNEIKTGKVDPHLLQPPPPLPATFSRKGSKPRPVHKQKYRKMPKARPPSKRSHPGMTIFFVVAFFGATYLVHHFSSEFQEKLADPTMERAQSDEERAQSDEERAEVYEEAISEFAIDPQTQLSILEELVSENPQDAIGQKAFKVAADYYSKNKLFPAYGNLLLKAKQPLAALNEFLKAPPDYKRAELALFMAYQQETDPEKKKSYLLKDIAFLVGPLNSHSSRALASARTQIFAQTFPGAPHPYAYYLLPSQEKINDVFPRLIPYFIAGVRAHLAQKFSQLQLAQNPWVSIKKDSAGLYRVEAIYQGPVTLGKEKKTDVKMVLWLADDQWNIVETNLATDMQRAIASQKTKILDRSLTADQMIAYLEKTHTAQLPKIPLHTSVPPVVKAPPASAQP